MASVNIGDENLSGVLSIINTCRKDNIVWFRCQQKGHYANKFNKEPLGKSVTIIQVNKKR